jgi:hypothetical protein
MNAKSLLSLAKIGTWLEKNRCSPILVVGAGPSETAAAKISIKSELDRPQTLVILRAALRACHDPRVCVVCGCTQEQDCPGGCCWIVQFKHGNAGVCSECWDQFTASVRARDAELI